MNISVRDEETQPQHQERTFAAQTTGSWTFTLLVFRTQIPSVIDGDWSQEAWYGQCLGVLWDIREDQTHGEACRLDSTAKRQPGDWQEPDSNSDKETNGINWGLTPFWCWLRREFGARRWFEGWAWFWSHYVIHGRGRFYCRNWAAKLTDGKSRTKSMWRTHHELEGTQVLEMDRPKFEYHFHHLWGESSVNKLLCCLNVMYPHLVFFIKLNVLIKRGGGREEGRGSGEYHTYNP